MFNNISYKLLKDNEFKLSCTLIEKFKKNIPLNQKLIEWEYLLNPFGKAKIFLAMHKKKAIGIVVAIPLKFLYKKKIFKGYRIQDVFTDINYIRNQIKIGKKIKKKNKVGIFSNLILIINRYLRNKSKINIGFANKNALPYWERNSWKGLTEFPLINKKLKRNYKFKCTYSKIRTFKSIHEEIFKKNILTNIDILWTKEFSNWRYFLNPRSKYKVFNIEYKKNIVGYVVLKEYVEKEQRIGHICQLVCDKSLTEDVIKFCMNYFFDRSFDNLSMWKINNLSLYVDKLGFKKKFVEKNKFIYKGDFLLNKSYWNLSMSYSDVY